MLAIAISAAFIRLEFVAVEDKWCIYAEISKSCRVKGEVTAYLDFRRYFQNRRLDN
jgi:hypothetical protein